MSGNRTRGIDGYMLANLSGKDYGIRGAILYIAEREFEPRSRFAGRPRMLVVPGTLGEGEWTMAATVLIRERLVVENSLSPAMEEKILRFVEINHRPLLRYWQASPDLPTLISTTTLISQLRSITDLRSGRRL